MLFSQQPFSPHAYTKSNWAVSIGKGFVYQSHMYMKVSDYVDSAKYIVSGLFKRVSVFD
jgi:hypothetical protein